MNSVIRYLLVQVGAASLTHYLASAFGYSFGTELYGQVASMVFLFSSVGGLIVFTIPSNGGKRRE